MNPDSDFRRPLFYATLVAVGLFAGILATLLLTQQSLPESELGRPRIERVDMGALAVFPPVVLPETLATRGYVDALTLNEAFKTVAAFVTPSVVFIEVESRAPRNWFHRGEREGGVRQSVGSGVIISSQGFVVTNNHVIEGASRIRVTLSDKRTFEANVVGEDPDTDLAVIRLEAADGVPAIGIGDADELEVGEWVMAIGNPFRLTSTVTAGIVSATGRQVNIIEDSFGIESFIQTDAAINPGNSGGALVNLRGELVGIATAIATESGSYEGYGFAVPVNLMDRVARDLIEFGEVQRGYLGVEIWPVDFDRAADLGLDEIRGVYLANVIRNLAADEAGLATGDVLLSIDGHSISEPNELQSRIALYRPGQALGVEVWRRGERRFFEVTLFGRDNPRSRNWFAQLGRGTEGRNAPPPEEIDGAPHGNVLDVPDWGVGLFDMSDRFRSEFKVERGAYIAYVESGGSASVAGVPRNTVLSRIGEASVDSADDARSVFEDVVEAGFETVLIEVILADGTAAFYEVDVPGR